MLGDLMVSLERVPKVPQMVLSEKSNWGGGGREEDRRLGRKGGAIARTEGLRESNCFSWNLSRLPDEYPVPAAPIAAIAPDSQADLTPHY